MEHEEKKGERKGRKACGEGGVFRDLVRRSSRRTQPEMRLLLSGRRAARTTRGQSRRLGAPPRFFALATGTFASR